MTREQIAAKARELKAAGIRVSDIAKSLGETASSVSHWTRTVPWPPRECYVCGSTFTPKHGNRKVCCGENARKRCHEQLTRARCIDCGDALGAGSGYPGSGVSRCSLCWKLSVAERVDKRARKIGAWWAEGLQLPQIADRLGWTKGHVANEFDRLRAVGYDLPYRYDIQSPRHPEQAAA